MIPDYTYHLKCQKCNYPSDSTWHLSFAKIQRLPKAIHLKVLYGPDSNGTLNSTIQLPSQNLVFLKVRNKYLWK